MTMEFPHKTRNSNWFHRGCLCYNLHKNRRGGQPKKSDTVRKTTQTRAGEPRTEKLNKANRPKGRDAKPGSYSGTPPPCPPGCQDLHETQAERMIERNV